MKHFLPIFMFLVTGLYTFAVDKNPDLNSLTGPIRFDFDDKGLFSKMLLISGSKPSTFNIWPGTAPGEIKELPPEADTTNSDSKKIAGKRLIRLGNVSTPQITIFKPEPAIDTGTSVIIAPGGGFNILAYDLEGTEVAEWLNTIGVTGIVLKYRVPARNVNNRWKSAVQDAQRTVSLVRAEAERIGIEPNKIGLMGFSAGAMSSGLTALLNERQYPPIDGYDQVSFKPDFVGIIYLGSFIHNEPGVEISPDLPPFFMAVAHDDRDRAIASALSSTSNSKRPRFPQNFTSTKVVVMAMAYDLPTNPSLAGIMPWPVG
ncbi:MAG: alpha/beta hydrolase [Verrucomicrobia bacterium]|nr:alpha/beta hydrolase [Verrucomicrobiota bacterium]MDA1068387.1 alpha/beta hydrolase [Verrucomicrobiota bacterium]